MSPRRQIAGLAALALLLGGLGTAALFAHGPTRLVPEPMPTETRIIETPVPGPTVTRFVPIGTGTVVVREPGSTRTTTIVIVTPSPEPQPTATVTCHPLALEPPKCR